MLGCMTAGFTFVLVTLVIVGIGFLLIKRASKGERK